MAGGKLVSRVASTSMSDTASKPLTRAASLAVIDPAPGTLETPASTVGDATPRLIAQSWRATTASSSSRSSRDSAPRVTTRWAADRLSPTDAALMAGVSATWTEGSWNPWVVHKPSTRFSSRGWSPLESGRARRARRADRGALDRSSIASSRPAAAAGAIATRAELPARASATHTMTATASAGGATRAVGAYFKGVLRCIGCSGLPPTITVTLSPSSVPRPPTAVGRGLPSTLRHGNGRTRQYRRSLAVT